MRETLPTSVQRWIRKLSAMSFPTVDGARVPIVSARIVQEERPYRLISDEAGHYAVVEVRCQHVYSLHCDHPRHGALDTPEGMEAVVGDDWSDYEHALQRYRYMVESEERFSQTIW